MLTAAVRRESIRAAVQRRGKPYFRPPSDIFEAGANRRTVTGIH
jgi:hypothetical protein